MSKRPIRTSDLAYAVGVHPNSVRQYEAWGWIPPVVRAPNGYRQFTEHHFHCICLVRACMRFSWLGGDIRRTAFDVVRSAGDQRFGSALQSAYQLSNQIRNERNQAETAAQLVQRWAHGLTVDATEKPLRIGEAARQTELTTDMLRNWEKDGLLTVPRNPKNGYRIYGTREISRLRIIRMLRHARYSTMAILRMLNQLDAGQRDDVRSGLVVPEEDIQFATDRWLYTLSVLEPYAQDLIMQLEWVLDNRNRDTDGELNGRELIIAFYRGILTEILEKVTVEPGSWRLSGAMAAYVRGIFVPFQGIDIHVKDANQVNVWAEMLATFPRYRPIEPEMDEDDHVSVLVRGVRVRIRALNRRTASPAQLFFNTHLWLGRDTLACDTHNVPTASAELDTLEALKSGKANEYRPWLRYMKKHTYSRELLVNGMQVYALPTALQQTGIVLGLTTCPVTNTVLAKYGVSAGAKLGSGMEADVYAYGDGKVLKIYKDTISIDQLTILEGFYRALDDQSLSYALPKIYSHTLENKVIVTIEKRLDGTPMSDVIHQADDVQLDHLMDVYLSALLELQNAKIPTSLDRYKLYDDAGISSRALGDWHSYLSRYVDLQCGQIGTFLGKDVTGFPEKLAKLKHILTHPYTGVYTLVHGDFFPGNLLVDEDLTVTALLDFGLFTMIGDPLFDLATGWVFFNMYDELKRNLRERLLRLIVECCGEQVRARLYLYVLFYSILSANVYSSQCADGHYLWCVTNLNNDSLWRGLEA